MLSGGDKIIDSETTVEGGPSRQGYGKKPCKIVVFLCKYGDVNKSLQHQIFL